MLVLERGFFKRLGPLITGPGPEKACRVLQLLGTGSWEGWGLGRAHGARCGGLSCGLVFPSCFSPILPASRVSRNSRLHSESPAPLPRVSW